MPETSALVTDTHPLLYYASEGRRLSRKAAGHFEACDEQLRLTFVPVAVIWECSLLSRAGKIDLGRSIRSFFADLFSNPAYQPIELTPDQIYDADGLSPNRDPFDGLICAAARSLDLPLLTRDTRIEASGVVRVVW